MSELPVSVTVPPGGVSTPLLGSLVLAEATLAPARATVSAMNRAVAARASGNLRITGDLLLVGYCGCRVEKRRENRHGRRPLTKRVGDWRDAESRLAHSSGDVAGGLLVDGSLEEVLGRSVLDEL